MAAKQCSNCKFFHGDKENAYETGVCRRYPPAKVATTYQIRGEIVTDVNSELPYAEHDGWCGEWKR